ncbi:uroporphyrinogen-III synthase [Halovulum marinum]|nr:uroporphyrinogen-III synthase [Halovulum marinum]
MDAQHDAPSHGDKPGLLIPRPAAQANAFAARVAAALPGRWRCVVAPLIEIRFRKVEADADDADTLVFTSANGVAAWIAAGGRRDRPAICVGAATARAARAAGLAAEVAGPDAPGLIATLTARRPGAGRYLHLRGAHAAADVAGALRAAGHPAREVVIYDQTAVPLPGAVADGLTGGGFGGVTLFSPRSARLLEEALNRRPMDTAVRRFCLSPEVARAARPLGGGEIAVAAAPTAEAMLRLLAETAAR